MLAIVYCNFTNTQTIYAFITQVAFTGSGEVGRLIMESAAKSNLKTVSLELGGKSPFTIFDDADVDMTVNLTRLAIFSTTR